MQKLCATLLVFFMPFSGSSYAADKVLGWNKTGDSSYEFFIDKETYHSQSESYSLKSPEKSKNSDWSQVYKNAKTSQYTGKKLKVSAFIKSSGITNEVSLWIAAFSDPAEKPILNMKESISQDTEWKQFEIVFDVPVDSKNFNYGVYLKGSGQIWLDDVSIDVVDTK